MSQQFETVAAIVVVTVCSAFLYQSTERTLSGFSVVFILWTILLWVTFRLRPRFVILSLFIMTTVSLASIILVPYHGTESLSSRVISIQIIDLLSDVIFLIIFSLEDLRRRGAAALHERAIDLENALEHIRMADKAKNEFIATLAHELRNPLATIVTSLELLEARGTNDPETHKTWHTMFQKTRVMQRLLDDLLDISRITRNQLTLQVELIDVRESLNLAIQGIRSHVAARSQILHVSLPSTPLPVMADPIRLEQIFVNLFGNASKYTPRGGSITLTAMLGGTQAVITIADTGFGIPEHMMERIFEPFVQIHRPEQKREGVGIGLALTKSLIEMHGGTIAVARRIDGPGSIFTVTLPLSERTIKPRHSTKQYTLDAVRPVRILVVDDNVDAAHSLQTLLSLKGHTVEIALNGHEAIEQVQAHPPDVVLLDIGLPDMTGHEVARRLRDGNSTLFIVALSGYGQESDRRKAYDAGFNRHLTKPASLGDIERLLREREEMENKTEGAIVTR